MGRSTATSVALSACLAAAACTAPDEPIAATITYYQDVAPLLARECVGCHRDGGVAPFSLETAAQAQARAQMIAHVTRERSMPPWPADSSGDCNTFVGQRWLSDDEIALLSAWADAGAPAGDPRVATVVPAPPSTPFSRTVSLAPEEPYVVAGAAIDEYRCFVVDPGLDADRYITAIGIELDHGELVHHIQLYAADDEEEEAALDALDGSDGRPGYACGGEGVGPDLRYVGVWAPGDLVRRWADGTGIPLHAHHRLVVQFHYHNHSGIAVADHTRVGLELADHVDEVGDMHHARNTGLFLLPGREHVEAVGTHPLEIDAPVTARGVRIHMHTLGTSGRLELVRGDQSTCLLSIPRWDFNWQLFYMLDRPITLQPGDQIGLTCVYDTRSRGEPVTWGTSTDDEMCIGYTYFTR